MKITEQIHKLSQRLLGHRRPTRRFSRTRFRTLLIEQVEERRVFAVIDLATLTAAQGTVLVGADGGDLTGWAVSSAGDVNGDGYDDFVIAAEYAESLAGESYLIFGGAILPPSFNLASVGSIFLPGKGVRIVGAGANDRSGCAVSAAGDVNGDGFDDVAIGSRGPDGATGTSYLIFGAASLPNTIDLGNLGNAGITFLGVDVEFGRGKSVNAAGDINGDGFDDLVIGAPRAEASGNPKPNAGVSYVVFGAAVLPPTISLATLGNAGVTLFGAESGDSSGWSVSGAGDINGDGFDDLLIGAVNGNGYFNTEYLAGESYVVFGSKSLPTTIDLANITNFGITIFGDIFDISGWSVSRAGDVNGDGFDDILIGAPHSSISGKFSVGGCFVIFGGASLPPTIDLARLGNAGITILGADAYDNLGYSASTAGDVNGDGFDDLLIAAYRADAFGNAKNNAGESYLLFGSASLPTTINLANPRPDGITIYGADALDRSGSSVSGVGDINGDGFDDWLIGAPGDRFGRDGHLGKAYLLFGRDFRSTVTHPGTAAADTLTGTTATDVMIGARGKDTLFGMGGADVLIGAEGDDLLAVSDITFKRVVGGHGTDTLRLDGSHQTLDLTKIRDSRLRGIERIDLNQGSNRLILNQREVLNLSKESNTLLIDGNSVDHFVLLDGGWISQPDQIINNQLFKTFLNGAATVISRARLNLDAPPRVDLANLDAAGIQIFGANAGDASGRSVRSAGDVNGDGLDDLLIGASSGGNAKGLSYLIFGGASLSPTINLANLGLAGITITGGDPSDLSGNSVSRAGDINGDGFDDLLIGAPDADASGNSRENAGESYVIFGGDSLPSSINLNNIATLGITIFGSAYDQSGISVSSAGDVNGDGFDDLLIGAPGADASGDAKYNAGESYVIFGGNSLPTTIDLTTLGSAGITIFGADPFDASGRSVSGAGDVNGDGFDDLLIGAPNADGLGNAKQNSGESYLIFGGDSLSATIDLATLANAGIRILGAVASDFSGSKVIALGMSTEMASTTW